MLPDAKNLKLVTHFSRNHGFCGDQLSTDGHVSYQHLALHLSICCLRL